MDSFKVKGVVVVELVIVWDENLSNGGSLSVEGLYNDEYE
jgi:hypothetical protein